MSQGPLRHIVTVLLIAGATACAPTLRPEEDPSKTFSGTRREARRVADETRTITRTELASLIQNAGSNYARIVDIYTKSGPPEYRVFDLPKNGLYRRLGLKERDTIVAINDLLVFDRVLFFQFPKLLTTDGGVELTVKRQGALRTIRVVIAAEQGAKDGARGS